MNDSKPGDGVRDRDFFVTPTAQELQVAAEQELREEEQSATPEDAELSAALGRFDFAPFALWLERGEREATDNPTAHAKHLMHAARILNAANNPEAACNILRRAASVARGHDAVSERKAVGLLWKYGGEQAVKELAEELNENMAPAAAVTEDAAAETQEITKEEQLAEVQRRYTETNQILVELADHQWYQNPKFQDKNGKPIYTEEQRVEEQKRLRALFQQLADRRGQLRQ